MTDEQKQTARQLRLKRKIENIVNSPNIIITTKDKLPCTKRVTKEKKPLKINPGKCQSGRQGSEPKELCPHCGEYMYKQMSRVYIDKKPGWIPTSWLCRRCGKMVLYNEGFKAVKID